MPRLRRDVAYYTRYYGVRKASRHFGIPPGTVSKWFKKARIIGTHPKQLSGEVVNKIIEIRLRTKRTSEVVHQELLNQGIKVSLNSVRRTIDRHGLMKKRSPWKRFHPHVERPEALKPGALVQVDTIHRMIDKKTRLYVFVLQECLDKYSNNVSEINRALEKYLRYYNGERLYMGISLRTPIQLIPNCFQAIG